MSANVLKSTIWPLAFRMLAFFCVLEMKAFLLKALHEKEKS